MPVWIEPDEPSHPLTGLVCALERAGGRAVVAAACDMPFVGAELLRRLAAAGGAAAARADHPFPGRYEPSALPVLRAALAREAPVREALAALAPAELGAPEGALLGVNTPEELAAAAARVLDRMPPSAEQWIEAFAAALGRPAPSAGGARRRAQARVRRRARLRAPRRADRVLAGRRLRAVARRGARARPGALRRGGRIRAARGVSAPDVAIAGGGIVGTALAALLAEAGASVRLYEREAIAAAASGRNSGVLQHPLDEALTGVHERSLALYAELGHGFAYPPDPCGVLVLSDDAEALERERAGLAARFPEVAPEWLEGAALADAEPGLGDGLFAYRLATGRPVPPAAAAAAWAERARAAGAELRIGVAVEAVEHAAGRVTGVRTGAGTEPAGAVAIAAGPWTAALASVPVAPLWGVNVEVRLPAPPRHVLEQTGIDALTGAGGGPGSLFSMVTAGGVSAVGSTFAARGAGSGGAVAPVLLERGARFLPALGAPGAFSARACPRPQSRDGLPLLGPTGRSRASTWPRATARGASRSARGRRSWSPRRSSATAGRSRPSWRRAASSSSRGRYAAPVVPDGVVSVAGAVVSVLAFVSTTWSPGAMPATSAPAPRTTRRRSPGGERERAGDAEVLRVERAVEDRGGVHGARGDLAGDHGEVGQLAGRDGRVGELGGGHRGGADRAGVDRAVREVRVRDATGSDALALDRLRLGARGLVGALGDVEGSAGESEDVRLGSRGGRGDDEQDAGDEQGETGAGHDAPGNRPRSPVLEPGALRAC